MIIDIMLVQSLIIMMFCDLAFNKIYNFLSYPLIIFGIFINYFHFGFLGIAYSLAGILFGLIFGYISTKLGLSYYGEIKLLMLIGAFKGYLFIAVLSLISIIIIYLFKLLINIKIKGFKIVLDSIKKYLYILLRYEISLSTIYSYIIKYPIISYSSILYSLTVFVLVWLEIFK